MAKKIPDSKSSSWSHSDFRFFKLPALPIEFSVLRALRCVWSAKAVIEFLMENMHCWLTDSTLIASIAIDWTWKPSRQIQAVQKWTHAVAGIEVPRHLRFRYRYWENLVVTWFEPLTRHTFCSYHRYRKLQRVHFVFLIEAIHLLLLPFSNWEHFKTEKQFTVCFVVFWNVHDFRISAQAGNTTNGTFAVFNAAYFKLARLDRIIVQSSGSTFR